MYLKTGMYRSGSLWRVLCGTSLLALAVGTAATGCSGKDDEEGGTLGSSCDLDDAASCNDGLTCTEDEEGAGFCLISLGELCDPEEAFCTDDLTCAETTEGKHRCFGRLVLRGMVTDTTDGEAIEGAHLLALNDKGSAVTDISASDEEGSYSLDLPAVRDKDGFPVNASFTVNASAQDYQPFPSGVRVALPISTEDAVIEDGLYVIDNALTNVGLIPLPAGERVWASGTVEGLSVESDIGGLLVVATGDAGTFTAVSDLSGGFTIFNLPDGDYELRAYGAGVQIKAAELVVSGEKVEGVSLSEIADSTTAVSGSIQIVNAPGGAQTSVILVVEDTFDENAARGEAPRGLRAPESGPVSIDGEFTIDGVPEGRYVVLAAYENDDLVRDPDTSIAGTDFVHIEVTAGDQTLDLSDSFKVTEALEVVSPGADGPEAVSDKPVLKWADDSSEEWYEVRVYDAFGEEVWKDLDVPSVSGSDTVTLDYEGPLEPGMYYQFRVTSWAQSGSKDPAPKSATEDLRGVFFLPAE